MTRDEAKRKIKLVSKESFTEAQLDDFLNVLVELGAIELTVPISYDTRTLIFSSANPCAYQAISQLESLGYKIVNKDNLEPYRLGL